MALTAKGFPYPVAGDGPPHIDLAIAALATRVEAIVKSLTDAEVQALAGVDLWDGRYLMQSNAGSTRKWRGLYEYLATGTVWRSLVPVGAWASFSPALTASVSNPLIGNPGYVSGWYAQFGARIIGRAVYQFGTSGATAGSGTWFVSLPVTITSPQAYTIGRAYMKKTATPFTAMMFDGELEVATSTTAALVGQSSTASGYLTAANAPFDNGSDTILTYTFDYRS